MPARRFRPPSKPDGFDAVPIFAVIFSLIVMVLALLIFFGVGNQIQNAVLLLGRRHPKPPSPQCRRSKLRASTRGFFFASRNSRTLSRCCDRTPLPAALDRRGIGYWPVLIWTARHEQPFVVFFA